MMRKAMVFLTHIITNILMQGIMIVTLFWASDTPTTLYLQYSLCCLGLLIADWLICRKLSVRVSIKRYAHFLDIIILNPSLLLSLLIVLGIFGTLERVMTVPLTIVFTINALLFIERWFCGRQDIDND